MNCKCFEETRDAAAKKMLDSVRKPVVTGSFSAKWRGEMFAIGDKVRKDVVLTVLGEVRCLKKDNKPEARMTKLECNVMMKYCPFCGTEIER